MARFRVADSCGKGYRASPRIDTAGSSSSRSNAVSAPPSATACRRVLLSSLEGSAVTSIKIAGVDHEFTSIRGVMEDATDIVLNVKSLVVRLQGRGPKTMKVTANKVGRGDGGQHRGRPGDRGDQQGHRPGDADRGRHVRDGNGGRERPRVRARVRADRRRGPVRAGDRADPPGRRVFAGDARALHRRRTPASARGRTTTG